MGKVFLQFGDELGEVIVVQLNFSLLQCLLDNAKAYVNGRRSLASGGFAPHPHQFGKCNFQSRVCTREHCECDGGLWRLDILQSLRMVADPD